MHPTRIFKTVHEFILSVAFIVFLVNAVWQFHEKISTVLSVLLAILAQLIMMDKKEWYASPETKEDDERWGL